MTIWLIGPTVASRVWFLHVQSTVAQTPPATERALLRFPATQPVSPAIELNLTAKRFHDAWRGSQRLSFTVPATSGTLFVGRLTTPRGVGRTVLVDAAVSPNGVLELKFWHYRVLDAREVLAPPSRRHTWVDMFLDAATLNFQLHPKDRLVLLGAAVDPADPARVRMPYQLNGATHELTFRLIDSATSDGDLYGRLQFRDDTALFTENRSSGASQATFEVIK